MNQKLKTFLIHTGLFVVTFITTTLAGAQLTGSVKEDGQLSWAVFESGMPYSIAFLFILTVHEFGHYFTAVYNRIKTSLPYYIPLPPGLFLLGTMGAVIRIKDMIRSKQEHFDIGIAGPLAGFVAALGILGYAFTHLPPPEYIFQIHPEYAKFGLDYGQHVYTKEFMKGGLDLVVGKNLLFMFFEKFVADPARMPSVHEMMHYPLLFAGFLSLVFTSLNLLPIGQLDGGHVLYGLLGYQGHRKVAGAIFVLLLFFAGLGFVTPANSDEWMWRIPLELLLLFFCLTGLKLQWQQTVIFAACVLVVQFLLSNFFPNLTGYPGWAPFLLIVRRFVGIDHPQAFIEQPLTPGRKLLGWLALVIFILCFTPSPLDIIDPTVAP